MKHAKAKEYTEQFQAGTVFNVDVKKGEVGEV